MAVNSREELNAGVFENETIDIAHYLGIIKRYAFRIISLAIAFTILVALLVMRMTPMYTSTTTILVEADKANVVSIEEVYGLDTKRKDYMQTQFEILQSRQIAERTVESLSLWANEDFMPSNEEPGIIDELKATLVEALPFLPQDEPKELTEEQILAAKKRKATSLLMSALSVEMVDNTQVMRITVTTESPQLSAELANAVTDVYIENYLQAKLDMTAKATSFLTESLEGLKLKLDVAERNLAKFYEENQVVNIDGVVGLAAEELEQLSKQLLDAQTALKLNAVIYKQTRNDVSLDDIARLPEVLNHPTIRDVRRDEAKAMTRVSELSNVYGPKHPRMIAANAELSEV